MEPFRQHNYLPAIEWVSNNCQQQENILFRLHSEHIIFLIENGIFLYKI